MAEGELILPDPSVAIEWRRYYLKLDFYPSIKLERRESLRFAESITEFLEPEDVQPGLTEWHIVGGGSCEGMNLKIRKNAIVLDTQTPPNSLEWYEHRFEPILEAFRDKFRPEICLHCNVIVTGLVGLGDSVNAQSFLGGYVMMMHPHKLAPIDRPLHVLGVRLLFPAYDKDTPGDGADWSVDVRVESAVHDEHKLFLEADADWVPPCRWEDEVVKASVGRIGTVTAFMSDRLIRFLRQPPFPDDEDESSEQ